MGEVMRVWGRGVWKMSVRLTQFCCELKTALKNKVYFKKKGEKIMSAE